MELKLNSYRKFIKDNLIVVIGHILIYAKGIILLPILIKNIGTGFYGDYIILMTGIGFICGISSFGAGFKFRRFIPSAETVVERRNLFYCPLFFWLISTLAISLVLIVSGNFIKTTVFKGGINFSMYLVVLILIFYVFYSLSTDFFRYTHRMNYFAAATTSQPYLMILLTVAAVCILNKKTLDSLLLAYLVTLIVISVPLLVIIFREIRFGVFGFRVKTIVEDIRLGFPLVLSYVLDFILSGSDKYVIAVFMTTTAVGCYSPACTLGSLVILLPKVFGVVLPPLLSNAADSGRDNEIKTLVNYSIKIFLLIGIPFTAASFVLSKPLLEVFANKQVADAAYLATPIVAAGILFYGLNLILSNVLFVQLKTRIMFAVNILSAGLNLLLNIVFIYLFKSILVAAVTTLVSYMVSFVVLNLQMKQYLRVSYDLPVVLKCSISSVLMGFILHWVRLTFGGGSGTLFLSMLVGIITYIAFLFAFRTFSTKELNFVRSYIPAGLRQC
jgi:O-antigen/teichoic acid export membrane protein